MGLILSEGILSCYRFYWLNILGLGLKLVDLKQLLAYQ